MNYYCLIAGLPDIHADDTKNISSVTEIKAELTEQLSVSDAALLKLLYAVYDNRNLLTWLDNREAALLAAGNLTSADWEQLVALIRENESPKDDRLLPYIHTFLSTYTDENIVNNFSREDYLTGLYYEHAMKCGNRFLRDWFEFNLNVNNILTAITCRKHGFDPKLMIIGQNEVAAVLRQTNARDFGLNGIFEHLEILIRIGEEKDLLEREKKIDALKWNWLEENSFFNYFGIEKILAFVLRVEMIERWKMLSVEKGASIFRDMLANLKQDIKIEDNE